MNRREDDLRTSDLLPGGGRDEHRDDRGGDLQTGEHREDGGPQTGEPVPPDHGRERDYGDREGARSAEVGPAAQPGDRLHREETADYDDRGEGPAVQGGWGRETALVDDAAAQRYQDQWMAIQSAFVDQPREAVAQADGLVAEIIQRVAESFAREREGLEQQWGRGEEVSTEELRQALQRYRAFMERLLST